MGARGNSGVITSQIFNGMAGGLARKRRFNGLDLAHALALGTETAYAAVKKPVEGTILTVIREAASPRRSPPSGTTRSRPSWPRRSTRPSRPWRGRRACCRSSARPGWSTPGGQGLYRLFQGALQFVAGEAVAGGVSGRAGRRGSTVGLVAHADEGYGYETMFLLQPPHGHDLDIDAIRTHLETIGESVVVAGDARAAKVHVHSERPDTVIAFGLGLGALSRISVENLDHQARDVRETRASEFTGATMTGAATTAQPAPSRRRHVARTAPAPTGADRRAGPSSPGRPPRTAPASA